MLQIWRSSVRIISILLLALSLLLLLSPVPSPIQARPDALGISFRGPEMAHLSYSYSYTVDYGAIEFGVENPSGGWRQIAYVEGENPSFPYTEYRDTELTSGDYIYTIRRRAYNVDTEKWGPWSASYVITGTIDGMATGTLLFDEEIADAVLGSTTIPEGKTLKVSGVLSGAGDLKVYGSLDVNGAVEMTPDHNICLYTEQHIANVTGASFRVYLEGQGSSLTDCNDISVHLEGGVTLNNIQNLRLFETDLVYLHEDQTLEINDSTITSSGPFEKGEVILNRSVVLDSFTVNQECAAQANETTFKDHVQVSCGFGGDPDPCPSLSFHSVDSRFTSLNVGENVGEVNIARGMFSGLVRVFGDNNTTFTSCEFASTVSTNCRNDGTFEDNVFMDSVGLEFSDLPPKLTIRNNAFMGRYAFSLFYSEEPLYQIPIGSNYYGDKAGYYDDYWRDSLGFLGYHSGHVGAYLLTRTSDSSYGRYLDLAPPLASSPVPAPRQDTRVLPRFWVNDYIVGQNTLAHNGSTGPILKGRDTLLSLHVVATDDNVQDARVYAVWDGQVIEPANNRNGRPVHRDHSLYTASDVRYGNVTYNFILPPVDSGTPGEPLSVPVTVYLDASGIRGFNAEAYPETDQELLSRRYIVFTDPPARALRIFVQPVEVKGLFGGSWGKPNPAGVIHTLRTDLPDMLPITADKVDLTRLPLRTFWSPSSSITPFGLMSRIAAGVGLARSWTAATSDYPPDFVVVVLPKDFVGQDFDGAAYAWSSRVLFVAEHKADAVLHELGHGVGLYTGWSNEQYELYPPLGLPVERATTFRTAVPTRRRIEHMAGSADFWYDLSGEDAYYYMDIMGNVSPLWTRPETVESFHTWFQDHLNESGVAQTAVRSPMSPTSATSPMSETRRVLLSGTVEPSGNTLRPDTILSFDVTGLDFPAIPPIEVSNWYAPYLRAYDAEGEEIYNQNFKLVEEEPVKTYERVWVATFDLPAETAFYCLQKKELGTLYCAYPTGLASTELLSPQPGDEIGAQFEAEWAVQATESVNEAEWDIQATESITEARLLHALFYQTAPDGPWQLGLMTQGTEISGPSSFLPDTDYLALRLLSSDGLARVEHVVEDLTVAARPPQVTIFSPQDGDQSEAGIGWQLSADAEDFSGEGLQPGRWHSSLEGDLGEGPNLWCELITGTHVLRYDVMSNNGLTGTSVVTVTVHDVMDALDLGLAEPDLTLHSSALDPTGYAPAVLIPGAGNTFVLRVRNQGVAASACVQLFVRAPISETETCIGEQTLALEPFEVGYVPFDFEPEAGGIHEVRAVIDQVDPPDPDTSNNEYTWTFQAYSKIYLPLITRQH